MAKKNQSNHLRVKGSVWNRERMSDQNDAHQFSPFFHAVLFILHTNGVPGTIGTIVLLGPSKWRDGVAVGL